MHGFKKYLLALVTTVFAGTASAGVCEAPFMHSDGYLSLSGDGLLRVQAQMALSKVRVVNRSECEAFVTGKASFGLMGLPAGSTNLNYWMTVKDGFARFERDIGGGKREVVKGGFDLNLLGLFNYDRIASEQGLTLPEQRFSVHFDKRAQKPVNVHTTIKRLGEPKSISTAAGDQQCYPVQYHRTIAATQASFNGLTMPIPEMKAQVTDWYCPSVQMVMRQESIQNGVPSYIEVKELR